MRGNLVQRAYLGALEVVQRGKLLIWVSCIRHPSHIVFH